MKKTFFLLFFVLCALVSYAVPDVIILSPDGPGHNHGEYYDPADKPEAYYDVDNQEIILVADGFASYYDVYIISMSTMSSVLYERIDGYGDTIDVSSLPDDDYKIIISTPYNNVYVGFFTNY